MIHDDARLGERISWLRSTPGEARFLSVYVEMNTKCNLKCRMCGYSDPRAAAIDRYDMPRPLFDSIAAQLFPRTSYLAMSLMTEPFMTADFTDRLGAVRQYGVPFSDVITNGHLLTEGAIEKVIDAGVSRFTVSIDGGTKALYESVRAGGNFDTVLRNVRLFSRVRKARGAALPRLRINHVLSEANVDAFARFLDLVEELGADMVEVRTISPVGDTELRATDDPRFWTKVRAACDQLAAFVARTGIDDAGFLRPCVERIEVTTADGEPMTCRRPWDTIAIHANGDAYVCMAWDREPLGNFARQTFEEIWAGPAMQALRAEFEAERPGVDCLHCTIRTRTGDRNDGEFFYRKVSKPLPA